MQDGILTLLVMATTLAMGGCSSKPAPITSEAAAISEAKKAWEAVHQQLPSDVNFGATNVSRFEPYKATLIDHEWHVVSGNIDASSGHPPEAFISAVDGTRWVALK